MKKMNWFLSTSLLIVFSGVFLQEHAFAQASAASNPQPRAYFDPARWEKDIQAFEAAHAANPEPENAVLFIGSSSVRLWKTIKEDLAPITIVHRGLGGSNMKDAVQYIDRIVIPHKPRAVVLYEGDNDLSSFAVSPATVMEQFELFVSKLRAALPDTRLYVLSIKPSIARMNVWDAMVKTNGLLKTRCASIEECTFIDVASPMFLPNGKLNESIFVADNIHMNADGYKIWTTAIKPVLHEAELAHE